MSDRPAVSHFPEICEPLLNTASAPGKNRRRVPTPFTTDKLSAPAAKNLPDLPDVSEVETVRHFTRLSRLNFGLDHGLYPLGSCTMKHNPKIGEETAAGFAGVHPADQQSMQPILRHLKKLESALNEICGMDGCCLWPAAGAHGELAGMMTIREAILNRGETRSTVLIPDTAHGTNPASCTIAGFETVSIQTGPEGYLTADTLAEHLNHDVAALMITNPNTLGIFEQDIRKIADLLHANGSYLYMDGANMNAVMGVVRPGDIGVDCMHLNLHKTFATPHGGGGPGSGPVLVRGDLVPHLPTPRITTAENGICRLESSDSSSCGKIHACLGNVAVQIKALTYIMSLGAQGLRTASQRACLNAAYLKRRLQDHFDIAYPSATLHEFVMSDSLQKETGVTTMDMAKALMDHGFHPPTVYFPLVVSGAMMIEPTETEPLDELDRFAAAMQAIAARAKTEPQSFHDLPKKTPVGRLDEVMAARRPVLTWKESNS